MMKTPPTEPRPRKEYLLAQRKAHDQGEALVAKPITPVFSEIPISGRPPFPSKSASSPYVKSHDEEPLMPRLLSLLVFSCPPKFKKANDLWSQAMASEFVKIVKFFDGAMVFVIARMWFDMLSAFVLGLSAIPYCGGFLELECAESASSTTQFLFAAALALFAGALKHVAEWMAERGGKTLQDFNGFNQVPMILKYIVGWAVAFATLQFLTEIKAATCDGDCRWLDLSFTAAVTLGSALLLMIIVPLSKEIEWSDHFQLSERTEHLVNFVEDLFEDICDMLARGLSVTTMTLWYNTVNVFLFYDTANCGEGIGRKISLLWAIAVTFGGSALAIMLRQLYQFANPSNAAAAAAPPMLVRKNSLGVRTTALKAAARVISLLQDSLAWLVGCAWTDVVTTAFTSLNADPYPLVIVKNLAVALVLSCFAVLWFVSSGKLDSSTQASDLVDVIHRKKMEAEFVSGAMAFFIGWVWLVVTRNIFSPMLSFLEKSQLQTSIGLDAKYIDDIAVLIFCPIISLLLINLVRWIVPLLGRKLGEDAMPTAAERAEETNEKKEQRAKSQKNLLKNADLI